MRVAILIPGTPARSSSSVRPTPRRSRSLRVAPRAAAQQQHGGGGNGGNSSPPAARLPGGSLAQTAANMLLSGSQQSSKAAAAPPLDGVFKATGRTAVITGASQGIGRATALLLARKGYNVVLASRDPGRLQYVADDCASAARRAGAALAVPTDVTNDRQVADLVNAAIAKYDTIDVVINSAGVFARGDLVDTPASVARRLMDVNYFGAYAVSQAFLPVLQKTAKRRGLGIDQPSLVMMNCFAGKVPLPHESAHCASKAALASLTEALRAEVQPVGVHVCGVYPGPVKSSLMERSEFYGADADDDRRSFRQMRRMLPISQTPQDVAAAVYGAIVAKQPEVIVGAPFVAAASAYRLTGVNVASLVP